eukprot:12657038-Ditylum_brightwellii.AAC.1
MKNRKHVNTIWGSNAIQDIFIPLLIYHYSQWMGGVDNMPNFHCQRNWVPMFIQILAIIRNNCFIVNREFY